MEILAFPKDNYNIQLRPGYDVKLHPYSRNCDRSWSPFIDVKFERPGYDVKLHPYSRNCDRSWSPFIDVKFERPGYDVKLHPCFQICW